MSTRIQKWGNSLGVRLPKDITEKYKLHAGSAVAVEAGSAGITIKPVEKEGAKLSELVKTISSDNRHTAVNWGSPAGNEIW